MKPGSSRVPGRVYARPLLTLALVTLNFVCWMLVAWIFHLSPLAPQNSSLLLKAGAVNGELLRAGEWWRILTSQFLHVHFPHLVFNMLALFLLGRALERETGSSRLALVYLSSGVAGQLAGVAANPLLVSSGASQAVMGLAGWTILESLIRPARKSSRLAVALVAVVVQVALDVGASGGIKAGHLAGFLAGVALKALFLRARPLRHK